MKNSLEQILASREIQPTAMRMLVLKELLNSGTALSLTELEAHFQHADKTTLYRTLKTFEKNKLVHSINDGTGSLKYALCEDTCECLPEQTHAHFHCTRCDSTICLKQNFVPILNLPQNFKPKEMSFLITGICSDCSD